MTPVEHVKELADFIKRVNDMSTLAVRKKNDAVELQKKESKNSDSDEEEDIDE